jgi:hypothetical protein
VHNRLYVLQSWIPCYGFDCADLSRHWQVSFGTAPHVIKCDPDGRPTDPIAVQFSHNLFNKRLLAVADYDGYVSMVHTGEELPDDLNVRDEHNIKAQWIAHHNAINALHWIKVRESFTYMSGS